MTRNKVGTIVSNLTDLSSKLFWCFGQVSDQKPLGSWTVKQGQCLTCSAVYNSQTKEYVAVTDKKVPFPLL